MIAFGRFRYCHPGVVGEPLVSFWPIEPPEANGWLPVLKRVSEVMEGFDDTSQAPLNSKSSSRRVGSIEIVGALHGVQ